MTDPDSARAEARDILDDRRFSPPELPDPFRGVLEWLAQALQDAWDWFFDLAGGLPGGRPVVWGLLLAVVATLAWLLARRLLRRRGEVAERAAVTARGAAAEDPDTLDRRAREAAARGDHELALRLGFRAGVMRLGRRGRLPARDSLSTGEVARAVRTPGFDRAAARFDEVVYGRRPAAAEDVEAARAAWEEALR